MPKKANVPQTPAKRRKTHRTLIGNIRAVSVRCAKSISKIYYYYDATTKGKKHVKRKRQKATEK